MEDQVPHGITLHAATSNVLKNDLNDDKLYLDVYIFCKRSIT